MNSAEKNYYAEYVYDDGANSNSLNYNLNTSSVLGARSSMSSKFENSFKKQKNNEVQDIYDDEHYCMARSSSTQRKDEAQINEETPFRYKKILMICVVLIFLFLFAIFGGFVGSLINRKSPDIPSFTITEKPGSTEIVLNNTSTIMSTLTSSTDNIEFGIEKMKQDIDSVKKQHQKLRQELDDREKVLKLDLQDLKNETVAHVSTLYMFMNKTKPLQLMKRWDLKSTSTTAVTIHIVDPISAVAFLNSQIKDFLF